jgi:hypothetical protein
MVKISDLHRSDDCGLQISINTRLSLWSCNQFISFAMRFETFDFAAGDCASAHIKYSQLFLTVSNSFLGCERREITLL